MRDQKVYSSKIYIAIGLMSGTSLDGIDIALIKTDGYNYVEPLAFKTIPYSDAEREEIRAAFGQKTLNEVVQRAEDIITQTHIKAVKKSCFHADIIGFHGQTIYHAPEDGITIQIGDGQKLAQAAGMPVVANMRKADVASGGQGAPLAPLYHAAIAANSNVERPCAFLNIGGVANITYINGRNIIAFDTGPGNALMDDWAKQRTGQPYDNNGTLAASGKALDHVVAEWLAHPYFKEKPPKSLDRDEWDISDFAPQVKDLGEITSKDGAATLLAFTVQSIVKSRDFLPVMPKTWYLCGGGRHNAALVAELAKYLPVKTIEELGFNGDAIEAEAFAYLAVRSLLDEPLSRPTTTGVDKPLSGGVLHKA